ncbi:BnaA02g29260D [Brassica napus]|uniref:BnaA02g29260D protein n=1 Tax=Brassica napus TaxID=3708 RepID=A0A078I8J8_BRANA|nr:BnaA02g29260D [Brassica napus]
MPLMEKPDNREMDLLTDGLPPIPILLTKIPKISGTESLLEDLYAIILAKLPLTSIITFKRVCKQWKSLVESPFCRDLYLSMHQNSYYSSWSFMCRGCETETMAHYGSDNWCLTRSLGSYISSFLAEKFENREGRVVAYTDVGLILIYVVTNQSFYVANPVSRQCVEILPHNHAMERFWILGIVTRTEDEVVLGYKEFNNPISLNGKLHWLAHNPEYKDFLVSFDFYPSGDKGSDRCRVTPFPDLDKTTKFKRACTTCQGFLMYINIVSVAEVDKLCVWRLKSEGWQLVSEISTDIVTAGFDYIPLGMNPFDDKLVYFWRGNMEGQDLLSINLHIGEFMVHEELERSSDGRVLSSVGGPREIEYIKETFYSSFVLPRWLHPFPN